jgi:hypothetical protein
MWPSDTTTKKDQGKSHLRAAKEKIDAIPDTVTKRDKRVNGANDEWFKANRQSMINNGVLR